MLEHLVEAKLSTSEQMTTIMSTAFKMLQLLAMALCRAVPNGMQPLFSIGHAYRAVISWESPALVIQAFRGQSPVIYKRKGQGPSHH